MIDWTLMLAQVTPADGLTVGWAVVVSCAAVLVAILGGVIQVASRIGVMTQTLADMREQVRTQLGRLDGEIEKRSQRHHELAGTVQANMLQIDRVTQANLALRADLNGLGERVSAAKRMAEQALMQSRQGSQGPDKGHQ